MIKGRSLTELGLARRFEELYHNDLRFSHSLSWLEWDGRRWNPERRSEAFGRVKYVADVLQDEARELDADERKPYGKAIRTVESARGASDILKVAEPFESFNAKEIEWDAQPWLFNCVNGTLDLRQNAKVRFRPHSRGDYLT